MDNFPIDEMILSNKDLLDLVEDAIHKAINQEDYYQIDEQIDKLVYGLYGINENEIAVIEKYIKERTEG